VALTICQPTVSQHPLAQENPLYLSTILYTRQLGISEESASVSSTPLGHETPARYLTLLNHIRKHLVQAFSREDILVFLLMLAPSFHREEILRHEQLLTKEMVAFFCFHTLFLDWPARFFTFLTLLYSVAVPPYTGTQKTVAVSYSHALFFLADVAWLQQRCQEHWNHYHYDREKAQVASAQANACYEAVLLKDRPTGSLLLKNATTEKQLKESSTTDLRPYPWEDLASVVARAARKLGDFRPQRWLHPLLTPHSINEQQLSWHLMKEDYAQLTDLLHLDRRALHALAVQRFAPRAERKEDILELVAGLPHFNGQLEPWLFPYAQERKACPSCLADRRELPDFLMNRLPFGISAIRLSEHLQIESDILLPYLFAHYLMGRWPHHLLIFLESLGQALQEEFRYARESQFVQQWMQQLVQKRYWCAFAYHNDPVAHLESLVKTYTKTFDYLLPAEDVEEAHGGDISNEHLVLQRDASIRPLPEAMPPCTWESLPSLLARAAERMGYRRTEGIWQATNRLHRDIRSSEQVPRIRPEQILLLRRLDTYRYLEQVLLLIWVLNGMLRLADPVNDSSLLLLWAENPGYSEKCVEFLHFSHPYIVG
jgi:hypothetical protein